jgi:maltodextrin utilization protein YvdJ
MARGTNLGVLFLLGVTVFVLASFASFFIYLMRRARLVTPPLRTEDPVSCSNS